MFMQEIMEAGADEFAAEDLADDVIVDGQASTFEQTRREIISPVLVLAVLLMTRMQLVPEIRVEGTLGTGPLDYAAHGPCGVSDANAGRGQGERNAATDAPMLTAQPRTWRQQQAPSAHRQDSVSVDLSGGSPGREVRSGDPAGIPATRPGHSGLDRAAAMLPQPSAAAEPSHRNSMQLAVAGKLHSLKQHPQGLNQPGRALAAMWHLERWKASAEAARQLPGGATDESAGQIRCAAS
ncbi:hypothetical protein COCSUDRAFT_60670 [Coccomyxa subellipsoidea C-169]|uniref:Uncharacterized protein n=1 Tax=Coccomyxa subellipsoidea (strain C-169) TaxID=574566 RepID=I0Z4T7_COCSC|nr:hypothetical protein COCSUDRAFT_60670 [Coccomyxa subellipsoidea C-169]EIE25656.1 hypothetical protein COCSUDRAFT_60670 [Coccomyxa subellipsoidea C-169]|eukprot:XP_005650200.1 hypothetical protein COCSUDRAFT_60670 [Coccomyxa subellipsoidea C-169]